MMASQVVDGAKQCGSCKEWKPVGDFYKSPKTATGLHSWCILCTRTKRGESRRNKPVTPEKAREYQNRYKARFPERVQAAERRRALMYRFGVTPQWYDGKLIEQNGLCAICKEPETAINRAGETKLLAVDHCHKSGDKRGLLCSRCNTAIGLMLDNPDRLRNAAAYIERSKS